MIRILDFEDPDLESQADGLDSDQDDANAIAMETLLDRIMASIQLGMTDSSEVSSEEEGHPLSLSELSPPPPPKPAAPKPRPPRHDVPRPPPPPPKPEPSRPDPPKPAAAPPKPDPPRPDPFSELPAASPKPDPPCLDLPKPDPLPPPPAAPPEPTPAFNLDVVMASIRERHELKPTGLKATAGGSFCSLHRVPHCLRRHNENAYDPQIISIGPFHFGKRKDKLQSMEEHKRRYQHDILNRIGKHCLVQFLLVANEWEEQARRCYSEEVELDSNTFVEMMVLDGLFIIELFRRALNRDYGDDPIFKLGWLRNAITMDLLLLENHIPFFILEILIGIYKDSDENSLMKSVCSFFGLPTNNEIRRGKVRHLLHLVHLLHSPLLPNKMPSKRMTDMIPNASRLQEAGIKLKKGPDSRSSNIMFYRDKGVIEIPHLKVEDATNSIFLNLVAFEQCFGHCKSHFSRSMYFLDCLIDDAKDVQILCENGIIDRWLSSDQEVAALFNKMGRELIEYDYDYHFHKVCKEIKQYHGASWHEWRASLMRNYFNNPWAIISVVAAIVLLAFTFTQTFFAVFPKFAYGN